MHLTKHTFIVAATTLVAEWNLSLNAAPIPDEFKQNGFAIGCQAYSFDGFHDGEAIEGIGLASDGESVLFEFVRNRRGVQ